MEEIPKESRSYEDNRELSFVLNYIRKELDWQKQEYTRRIYELIEYIVDSEVILPAALKEYIDVCTEEKRFIDLEYFSKQNQFIGQTSADTALAVHRTAQIAAEVSRRSTNRKPYFQSARDLREKGLLALAVPDGHIHDDVQLTLYTYLDNIEVPY